MRAGFSSERQAQQQVRSPQGSVAVGFLAFWHPRFVGFKNSFTSSPTVSLN